MESDVLRDLIISITGGLCLVLFIIIGILGFLFYRQVQRLTRSIKETITTIKDVNAEIKETVRSSKMLFDLFKRESFEKECRAKTPDSGNLKPQDL